MARIKRTPVRARLTRRKKIKELTRGQKISQSKRMIKEAAERLPIGQIVYIKYHPKMVGIVTSKPRIWRFKWAIAPELVRCEVDVMWLQCPYYVSGTVETLNCKRLMPKKDNKSVEIGKAPVV